jgi:hypothetical protein
MVSHPYFNSASSISLWYFSVGSTMRGCLFATRNCEILSKILTTPNRLCSGGRQQPFLDEEDDANEYPNGFQQLVSSGKELAGPSWISCKYGSKYGSK